MTADPEIWVRTAPIRSHRAPRRSRRWPITLAVIAALVLVTGAAFVLVPAAGAESGLSQLELAQVTQRNCQIMLAHASTSAARTRARNCIADQQVVIDALSATQTPSVSPSTTPVPSPTVAPTTTTAPATSPPAPSPTPTGTLLNCLAQLAACGFPYDLNTGPVPPLTVSTRTTYATAGETVSGVEIQGCVEVRAANVTFRNVRIIAPCFWAVRSFAAGTLFEDVEITCSDTPGSNGYSNGVGGSATLRRADIHDCENGLNVPGNTTVVDSWIHGLYDGGDAHTDGAQFNQGAANIRFEHNTIDVRGNTTSAIIMWDEGDPQNRDVSIANNLMAGGAYTIYCGRYGTAVNVVITGNRFGPFTYGYANSCNTGGEVWSGNVRDSDGATLAAT